MTAEQALADEARHRGVRVHAISPLYHPSTSRQAAIRSAGLVMGYALLERAFIDEGIRRLAQAVAALVRSSGSHHH
ncbi:hypothetical protein [Roseateles sp.]|uniref:hypothetical protein n=1 Tax=Roseateles sp. TaxID=1971397 RepID=UPI0039E82671